MWQLQQVGWEIGGTNYFSEDLKGSEGEPTSLDIFVPLEEFLLV